MDTQGDHHHEEEVNGVDDDGFSEHAHEDGDQAMAPGAFGLYDEFEQKLKKQDD